MNKLKIVKVFLEMPLMILAFILFSVSIASAFEWTKTYGGPDDDYANSIQKTSDGGYIVASYTNSFDSGNSDAWVLNLDGNGNINNSSIVNTSNAQVSDTSAVVQNTNVLEAVSDVSPQTTIISVLTTNTVVTEISYDGPQVFVSPSILSFGAVKVGTSSLPSMITILNTGTFDLHISDMTLSDTVNYSLNVNGGTNPCGNTTPTIAPDNSCTVTVSFKPTSTGELDGSLLISSDDPDTPTVNVSLTGRGTLPRCYCEVFPNATIIPRGGTLRFLAKVTNTSSGTWIFDYATKVIKPNGKPHPTSGYLLGPIRIRLTYHESKSKYISHFIPEHAPLGIYTYHVYIVGVSGDIWDECTFDFEVTQ